MFVSLGIWAISHIFGPSVTTVDLKPTPATPETWAAPEHSRFSMDKEREDTPYYQQCKERAKQPRPVEISGSGALGVATKAAAEAGIDVARLTCSKEVRCTLNIIMVTGPGEWPTRPVTI